MPTVNGYVHDDKWKDAANGQWLFAKKDGEEYFLKRFNAPKYPGDKMSEKAKEAKRQECTEWFRDKKEIIRALQSVSAGGGNIVTPLDIFLDKPFYCQATRKVDTLSIKMEEICRLPSEQLFLLISTLLNAMKKVHSANIIHGDLKPDNIIIEKHRSKNTGKETIVCKVIDFDDSYFSQKPPLPEDTVGTEPYWSPELGMYKCTLNPKLADKITCKSDVFTLGLILHQYCTGGKYPELNGIRYPYQILSNKQVLKAFDTIKPVELKQLIEKMLLLSPGKRPSLNEVCLEFANMKDKFTSVPVAIEKKETPKFLPRKEMFVAQKEDKSGKEKNTCTVRVNVSLPEAGIATVNGETLLEVNPGDKVTLYAKENKGYQFVKWQVGNAICKDHTRQVPIRSDVVIEAVFMKENEEWISGKKDFIVYRELPNGKIEIKHSTGKKYIMDRWQAEGMGWI